jgi:hypothetical protein
MQRCHVWGKSSVAYDQIPNNTSSIALFNGFFPFSRLGVKRIDKVGGRRVSPRPLKYIIVTFIVVNFGTVASVYRVHLGSADLATTGI